MPANSEGVNIVITGDASQAINELARVEKSFNAFLGMEVGSKLEAGFGSILSSIAAGFQRVANAVSNIAKSALAIGGGFEAQMTAVKVISGATGDELEALTKKAREMGATLPITAKDAATAMTLLAQRGTSVKDILASVTDVANLAISQGVSMGSAADLLGSTMTNFSIAIEDAAKVTAIFNNASNQSALNMSKLTEALKYVDPTAGSIGMELTEAISAMEALANAGLTGEMTGTGLAMVLTKLSTKTRIMGVETKDLQGNLRPLADIFSELQSKGFSLAEATAEFGARGRLAALNLAKQSDALKTNEERLKNWGSTQAAVDEKAKTFTNTMAAYRSAIEEIHIEIFEQIKNQSKEAISGITTLIRTLSDWVVQTKIAEKALNAFLDGLGFNIPSDANFKKLLEQLDVQAVVDRIKSFGATIKSIADSIIGFVDKVKTPLLFLIEHLDTFATISFWGWITGKALQIPFIIISLANSFLQLASALKALSVINFSSIIAFLSNPIFLTTAASIAVLGTSYYKLTSALEQLREAKKEEMRFLTEQAQADSTLDLDIKFNIKTGFEKLPVSWTKASDELREKANADVKAIQEAFRENVGNAIEEVIAKFPDMAEAFSDTAEIMSNQSLRKITQALQGSKEVFDALPEHIKKVVEQLYYMDVRAGQTSNSVGELLIAYKELQQQISNSKAPQQSEVAVFAKELSASVNNLVEQLPANIERLQEFLGENNIEVAVKFSLEDAQKKIKELSKSLAEKFNVPKEFISSAIFNQLKSLADKGDKTAQSLYNSWKNSTEAIDNFLQKAQDAVTYLGASPDKFTPALNSLVKGIQKIDPITGKVTEQFKKAHDALKQWGNVTFSQLEQRIQRLRKAVEGGFIDKSVLEKEYKRVSQQMKIQIAAELEPSRSSYQSQQAFNSVVASEYISRMGELGGQAFADLVQKEFANMYDKSGSAIGAAIMRQVEKDASSAKAIIKIDGVDVSQQLKQSQSINLNNITKPISDSIQSFANKLEQFKPQQISSNVDVSSRFPEVVAAINKLYSAIENNSTAISRANEAVIAFVNSVGSTNTQSSGQQTITSYDYSSEFAGIVKEIQNISVGLSAIQGIVQSHNDNINNVYNAIGTINSSVNAVETAIKSQQSNSASVDSNSITQAVIAGVIPVVSQLDQSSENVARNLLTLQSSLDALKNSTDNSIAALDKAQATLGNIQPSSNNYDVSGALTSIISNLQALSQAVSTTSLDTNAITQAILSGINPLGVKLDANGAASMAAANSLSKYLLNLEQSIETLKKSADSNTNALSTLQNSIINVKGNASSESFSGALVPVVNSVQALATSVASLQSINQASSEAIQNVITAVKSLENTVKSSSSGNTFDIDINQQGFVMEKKSDADLIARNTASALRSWLGNGGV